MHMQMVDALAYLHHSGHVIHRNVCPSAILITKRGIWKLGGMEFMGESRIPKQTKTLLVCIKRVPISPRLPRSTHCRRTGGQAHDRQGETGAHAVRPVDDATVEADPSESGLHR